MPVTFLDPPDSTLILDTYPDVLHLEVTGHGYGLLRYYLNPFKGYHPRNFKTLRDSNRLVFTNYQVIDQEKNFIQNQLPKGVRVMQIQEDSLYLKYSPLIQKRLPLKLGSLPETEASFLFMGATFEPKVVNVIGPAIALDALNEIQIDAPNSMPLKASRKFKVNLRNYKDDLKIQPSFADLEVEVMPLGERSFKVEVQGEDNLILLPNQVEVKAWGAMSRLKGLSPDSFKLQVILDTNERLLDVQPLSLPKGLAKVEVNPRSLEYLIQK